ncbi:MAG: tRNA 2-thiouridine(34) synthase MnmA [Oscillospiraceae bacterium]|nr:tRNA 2-thiouridine(34) synthase MnmA [Oscillospiraceae bacterium]
MKVVLGFSGGVDSAVSAALLRRAGWEVVGLYLDNTDENARRDAVDTAAFLSIPLEIRDVRAELEEKVCAPFCQSYLRGETPNPCILCNPSVKFRALLETADRLGAEAIATGHYARAEGGALYKGQPSNDQSYMLCRLRREQLDRLVLPLGGMEKTETRALAERLSLPVAHKKDSMEICFIPDKDYVGWLSRRGELPPPGDFIFHGEVVGRHEGIVRYTVGQRKAGLIDGRKVYISRIDAGTNAIELALWEELFKTELTARDFNWLIDVPAGPIRAGVRVRHTRWEEPACIATPIGEGRVRIECDTPVRAPAPGQSAVLYDGDKVLGGGFIV